MTILNITTDRFVPATVVASGTVTTNGAIFETSASDQVKVGDYITDASQKRKQTS